MARFSSDVLESFFIDPRAPAAWAQCPFCPGTLLKGFRKGDPKEGGGRLALAHTHDKMTDGTTEIDCTQWVDVGSTNPHAFLVLAKNAGARWAPLVG